MRRWLQMGRHLGARTQTSHRHLLLDRDPIWTKRRTKASSSRKIFCWRFVASESMACARGLSVALPSKPTPRPAILRE